MNIKHTLLMLAAGITLFTSQVAAGRVGLITDNTTRSVVAFDPVTNTVKGSVAIPGTSDMSVLFGDAVITPDGRKGFVADGTNRVWVIDLTGPAPVLAAGPNPIMLSANAMDLAMSKDGRFIVVASHFSTTLLVLDVATQTEVAVTTTTETNDSVDICDDNVTVLGLSSRDRTFRKFILNPNGTLQETASFAVPTGISTNPYCAPGSKTAVVFTDTWMKSYALDTMALVTTAILPFRAVSGSGAINETGDKLIVRTMRALQIHNFDPQTGVIDTTPVRTIALPSPLLNVIYAGLDSVAMWRNTIYVPQASALHAYDIDTGSLLAALSHPSLAAPIGVATAPPATFTFTGFQAPAASPPKMNIAKAGTTIPVRFGLGGNQGLDIFAAGTPASQQMECEMSEHTPVNAVRETSSPAASGLAYDASPDRYTYHWATNADWAGTCRALTLRFVDGSTRVAVFKFIGPIPHIDQRALRLPFGRRP